MNHLNSIQIGITSDSHLAFSSLVIPDVPIFIHAGDLSLPFGDLETVKSFYTEVRKPHLSRNPDSWFIICPGNHDSPFGIELLKAIALDNNDQKLCVLE